MKKLFPRSLAGQLIALTLAAVAIAQIISLIVFWDDRRVAIRAAIREQVFERTISIVRLLQETHPSQHAALLRAGGTGRLFFSLDPDSIVPLEDAVRANSKMNRRLAHALGVAPSEIRMRLIDGPWRLFRSKGGGHRPWHDNFSSYEEFEDDHDDDDDDEHDDERRYENDDRDSHHEYRGHAGPHGMQIAIRMDNGRWLNVSSQLLPPPPWTWQSLLAGAIAAILISAIVVFMARRIARPMRALAEAAETFGRGGEAMPLAETGPLEVRRTTRAFKSMRERIDRFVRDRTRMLAAISHDLRTPITSLRIRAEFIEDAELRSKILESLTDMHRMTEESLAFLREEAAQEPTRSTDLSALIDSLCEDLRTAGQDVLFIESPKVIYPCRPVALKRALSNLIGNAVRYGQRARVSLKDGLEDIEILVEDDGPGIPEDARERVFEPFVRLEESRSSETGGLGLGMAIARSIVRAHGGDIALSNRPEGGLRATLHLPQSEKG